MKPSDLRLCCRLQNDLLQIPAETLYPRAGLFEIFGRSGVRNAEGGAARKRSAVNNGDAFFFQQCRGEGFVVDDLDTRFAGHANGACARWIDIECAFRRRALEAARLVEHGDHEIAALFEDRIVLFDEVLRTIECFDGGPLSDR